MIRSTHTYARLPLSPQAYEEIATKLRTAGYDHAFIGNGDIDMHGIAVSIEEPDRFECLFGSDILPSLVKIGDHSVQLGEVVRCGFERTGMTVKQWNSMESSLRDAILLETVNTMKEKA
jgi:hypothetical protein